MYANASYSTACQSTKVRKYESVKKMQKRSKKDAKMKTQKMAQKKDAKKDAKMMEKR